MVRSTRKFALFVASVGAIGALGGSAFTASNTMPSTTRAGTGTVTATGYTATSIDYTLDSTDPSVVSQVDVKVSGLVAITSNAKVQLSSAGSWYDCTIGTINDNGTPTDTGDDYTPLTCTTSGTKTSVSSTQAVTLVIVD